jgi:hypothetical protein
MAAFERTNDAQMAKMGPISVEKLLLKHGAAADSVTSLSGDFLMMGERTAMQEALFFSFSIEDHVPADHLLHSIDRFVDLGGIRVDLLGISGEPMAHDLARFSN